ncbi:hypothetical protein GCM10010260_59830 [Streptomyces filipinensis]|uniref:Uncharacterized protein n=1 Tax=Streptomyces filipinensis TaxID=66887 RepID=A0A918IG29_9ACTN|nr:hypothetical protein GCM10010260_59830 [Streptomyces filipinensis]
MYVHAPRFVATILSLSVVERSSVKTSGGRTTWKETRQEAGEEAANPAGEGVVSLGLAEPAALDRVLGE